MFSELEQRKKKSNEEEQRNESNDKTIMRLNQSKCNKSESQTHTSQHRPRPFKKVLYLDQPYEDNYVNEDFLAGMIRNAHVQPYDYWTCVREIGPLCQQISLLIVFFVAFKHILENIMPIDILITVDIVLLIVGYLVYYLFNPAFNGLVVSIFPFFMNPKSD